MNPGMFFDEVLESHEFRSSDSGLPEPGNGCFGVQQGHFAIEGQKRR